MDCYDLLSSLDPPTGVALVMDNIVFHESSVERNSVRMHVQRSEYLPMRLPRRSP
jgi:hypothetical protein